MWRWASDRRRGGVVRCEVMRCWREARFWDVEAHSKRTLTDRQTPSCSIQRLFPSLHQQQHLHDTSAIIPAPPDEWHRHTPQMHHTRRPHTDNHPRPSAWSPASNGPILHSSITDQLHPTARVPLVAQNCPGLIRRWNIPRTHPCCLPADRCY